MKGSAAFEKPVWICQTPQKHTKCISSTNRALRLSRDNIWDVQSCSKLLDVFFIETKSKLATALGDLRKLKSMAIAFQRLGDLEAPEQFLH